MIGNQRERYARLYAKVPFVNVFALTLTLTLILLAAHSTLAQKVVVELDKATDFSKYKIFAILDGQMHSKNRVLNSKLVKLFAELGTRVVDFSDMSVEEVAQAPPLSPMEALSKLREYDEPFRIQASGPGARSRLLDAQRRESTLIIQKSLREGFGMTVTENLSKKKPVVAYEVGGIPTQVIHKHTGLLAHDMEGRAYWIRFLLSNPAIAAKLGEQGHEHVREHFLIASNAKRYLTLFLHFRGNS
jgi:glycosyltransferase involved in cell wall biosynthesis